jgi:hypothetical protein
MVPLEMRHPTHYQERGFVSTIPTAILTAKNDQEVLPQVEGSPTVHPLVLKSLVQLKNRGAELYRDIHFSQRSLFEQSSRLADTTLSCVVTMAKLRKARVF